MGGCFVKEMSPIVTTGCGNAGCCGSLPKATTKLDKGAISGKWVQKKMRECYNTDVNG
jgi:hypothetical protein